MGADGPMMRSRKAGGGCRVPGHQDWCEVSTERRNRDRHDDHAELLRLADEQIARWREALDLLADR